MCRGWPPWLGRRWERLLSMGKRRGVIRKVGWDGMEEEGEEGLDVLAR